MKHPQQAASVALAGIEPLNMRYLRSSAWILEPSQSSSRVSDQYHQSPPLSAHTVVAQLVPVLAKLQHTANPPGQLPLTLQLITRRCAEAAAALASPSRTSGDWPSGQSSVVHRVGSSVAHAEVSRTRATRIFRMPNPYHIPVSLV